MLQGIETHAARQSKSLTHSHEVKPVMEKNNGAPENEFEKLTKEVRLEALRNKAIKFEESQGKICI